MEGRLEKMKDMNNSTDHNGNPIQKYPSKHFPYENKRKALHMYFYKLHGNGWWYFLKVPPSADTFINQFRKKEI